MSRVRVPDLNKEMLTCLLKIYTSINKYIHLIFIVELAQFIDDL